MRSVVCALAAAAAVAALILGTRVGSATSTAGAPVLLTRANSTRAIALESISQTAEPFALNSTIQFGSDKRTRVLLVATNLTLDPGENESAVTAEAQDGALVRYPLTVEYVGAVPGQSWMTSVVVRFNDNLGDVGDVLVGITWHGMSSNRVRIGIGHIGGGPPDDPSPTPTPTPAATPELGSGASLHGRLPFPNDFRGTRIFRPCQSIPTPAI